MRNLAREMQHLIRKLGRSPSFTGITVLTLALGIGANASIFSVVNAVLLRPLPFPEQERIYAVGHTAPGMNAEEVPNSEASYLIYREENRVFQSFGVYRNGAENITGGQEPERAPSLILTHDVFQVFGAVPRVGRLTGPGDDLPGAPPVTVLSHGLWQRRFGGDPDAVGRALLVDGEAHEIIGVLPRGFGVPEEEADLYLPARFDPAAPDEGSFNYSGVARLKAGVTTEAVEADMERMIRLMPDRFTGMISHAMLEQIGFAPRVLPLKEAISGEVSQALWILLASAGFLLLIACANVANLFLVRAEGRRREVAVRTALGAGRGDLARHFLGESLLLGILGGGVGFFVAWGAGEALVAFGPRELPRLEAVGVDFGVLLFTGALSLLAGILFGLFPLVKFCRPDLVAGLKEGARGGSAGRDRHRARNVLVASQLALALVLLTGSGLMLRSFANLRKVDPGFRPQGILVLDLTLPAATYPDPESRLTFHRQLHERLRKLPGVEKVGATSELPLSGNASASGTWFEDQPLPADQLPPVIETGASRRGSSRPWESVSWRVAF